MNEKLLTPIEVGLTAAIEGNEPLILTTTAGDGDRRAGLPFGPFDAVSHKLKYRPVVFELLPPEFTLTDLQRTVEAISGP